MALTSVLFHAIAGVFLLGGLVNVSEGGYTDGQNKEPGFKTQISQSGLNLLRDVGLEQLNQQIKQITIPDIHGRANIKIGHADYDVTSIHVTSFTIPTSSLTTNPSAGGLTLLASGISLGVHGNWHYKVPGKFIHLSDSGSFDASASGISLTVTLRIGVDSTGRPTISSHTNDCSFHVGSLHVKLHGGASWLYNLFDHKIADSLKSSLTDKVCKTVLDEVNTNTANKLKTLKVVQPINDVAEIDYSIIASPTFNGSLNLAHKGEVYPIGKKTECPLPVPEIAPDSDKSHMLFLWITEYLPNSAGYVLQNLGYLQFNVTPDNVPEGEQKYLNTSYAAYRVIPLINKKYPNMAMQIYVNSTKAPTVKITPTGIQAVLVGDFSPYAILPNKSLAYLFTLSVTINAEVDVNFKNNSITWKITTFTTDMSTVRSEVGFVFTPALEVVINSAIDLLFIPYLNQQGARGAPLPQMDDFELENPVITQGPGFLKIGTDLKFKS